MTVIHLLIANDFTAERRPNLVGRSVGVSVLGFDYNFSIMIPCVELTKCK